MDLVVVGGSDAGISAGLRARELDPSCRVTVIVADAYPNFSICGIPYFISGDVVDWRDLAHRTHVDLQAAGLQLRLDTRALSIDPHHHELSVAGVGGTRETVSYDGLVVGTGAVPFKVSTTTQVSQISRREGGLRVEGRTVDGPTGWDVDLVLVVTGVTPDTPTCPWEPPLTSKGASREPTQSAEARGSREASAPKW